MSFEDDDDLGVDMEEKYSSGFEPLPNGEYPVLISDITKKETAAGNGILVTLKLEVTEGEHQGRILFENLCVRHEKEQVQSIAQAKLQKACAAAGLTGKPRMNELMDRKLIAVVKAKKNKDSGELENQITAYKPYGKAEQAKPAGRPNPFAKK